MITRSAVKITQGDLTLYATSFKVEHLLEKDFYKIEKLDTSESSSGFQRVLDKARAKRLANYLLDGWKDGDAFLPTSILLATDKPIPFDAEKKEIKIDLEQIKSFNVVDGQHRIEGLIQAAKDNPEIKEFEIPTNIAEDLDEISQMCHFLIVNTTQKSVDKSVEQQILSRLSSMIDIEDIPTLPKWIQKQVLRGEDREALIIINYLNSENDSPWKNKIRMANEPRNTSTINQNSFVQAAKLYLLTSSNPLVAIVDIDKRNRIIKNYWKAITNLLVEDINDDTVIFKTIGVELFSLISSTIFNKLLVLKDFRVETIENILRLAMQQLPAEHLHIQDPTWWKSGGGASNINKAAARKIAYELNKCINSVESANSIVLL